MLKKELIEKIFDNFKVEGFKYKNQHSDSDYDIIYITEFCKQHWYVANIKQWGYYNHFLTRVIEGINRNPKKYYIELCRVVTVVNLDDGTDFMMFNTVDKTIDQAKEQAIIYILERLC